MSEIELFVNNFYNFAPCRVLNYCTMEMNFLKKVLGGDTVIDGGYYFCDNTPTDKADVVIISTPWSVTSDFGRGATYTPDAIIEASVKSGIYDALSGVSLAGRISTVEINYDIQELSEHLGREAERVKHYGADASSLMTEHYARKVAHIDEGFATMQQSTYEEVKRYAEQGKCVAVIGGDHSVAYGAVKAIAECHGGVGVLFIDAHADFCQGEPFRFTHRSIARNIIEDISLVERLVAVGVRDISPEEALSIESSPKSEIFLAERLASERFEGRSWGELCREIVERLPQQVYISFDIDALKIEFCHNTNAPVPGGMTFDEVIYLINSVVESGRKIVGFDISEIVPNLEYTMDATVGARLLSKMIVAALK